MKCVNCPIFDLQFQIFLKTLLEQTGKTPPLQNQKNPKKQKAKKKQQPTNNNKKTTPNTLYKY